ncbi:hypothetical protein L2E82_01899 [Cichorium intybus]|uniref:Uncharacterized protein n=1 Tax=Cichorium intybus TaxID=13427 RepID=A0ACB9H0U2_CICIN|nr:hypothetical protein L2E82_01899 [Cichorium intybus]
MLKGNNQGCCGGRHQKREAPGSQLKLSTPPPSSPIYPDRSSCVTILSIQICASFRFRSRPGSRLKLSTFWPFLFSSSWRLYLSCSFLSIVAFLCQHSG